ncbi:MAG: hypothetical protein U9Q98_06650 [Bacteroidota bacterium]|nr:hypothetical protein [Bacteroidota bacterium]
MSKKLIRFDWAMKTILREKANFDVLEGFLSALLEDDNIEHGLKSQKNEKCHKVTKTPRPTKDRITML